MTDQVRATRLTKRLAGQALLLLVPPEEEGLHQLLLAKIANDRHRLGGERIDPREVHGGGDGHGRRNEVLDLARAQVSGLEPEREIDRVSERRTGVTRDEISRQVLILPCLLARLAKRLGE